MSTNNPSRCYHRMYATALVCIGAGAFSAASFAAEPETRPPQRVVRLGDLNLSQANDVAAAYARLRWAAQQVCPFADSTNYWLRVIAQPCVADAIGRAVDSVKSPMLTSYYQSRSEERPRPARAPSGTSVR
jgi:UrcA family protein